MGRLTPAITSTLPVPIAEMARFDGVPPNMSVEQDHAVADIDRLDGVEDVFAPHFHIVLRPDADGAEQRLRTDDMLGRRLEFVGKAAMGNENDANHEIRKTPGPQARPNQKGRSRAAHYIVLFATRLNA